MLGYAVNMGAVRNFCRFFVHLLCRNNPQSALISAITVGYTKRQAKKTHYLSGGLDNAFRYISKFTTRS